MQMRIIRNKKGNQFMKFTKLIALIFGVSLLAGCQINNSNKPKIMATLYPQYSLVEQLAGDLVEVEFLLKPGISVHSFEPTPSQVVSLNNADIVFFTNENVETWIHALEETAKGKLIDLSANITLIEGEHSHEEEDSTHEDDNDHDHGDYDPHFWLDPKNGIKILDAIYTELVILLPSNENLLTERKIKIENQLNEIISMYENLVPDNQEIDLVFGGHNSFGYLEIYGIHFKTPYEGYSDDVLPTAQSISSLIAAMKEAETTNLFVSTTDNLAVIEALKEQFQNLKTITLYNSANVSQEQLNVKISYQSLLQLNYEAILNGK